MRTLISLLRVLKVTDPKHSLYVRSWAAAGQSDGEHYALVSFINAVAATGLGNYDIRNLNEYDTQKMIEYAIWYLNRFDVYGTFQKVNFAKKDATIADVFKDVMSSDKFTEVEKLIVMNILKAQVGYDVPNISNIKAADCLLRVEQLMHILWSNDETIVEILERMKGIPEVFISAKRAAEVLEPRKRLAIERIIAKNVEVRSRYGHVPKLHIQQLIDKYEKIDKENQLWWAGICERVKKQGRDSTSESEGTEQTDSGSKEG